MKQTAVYCLRAFVLPIFLWAGIYTTCELFVRINRLREWRDPDPRGQHDLSQQQIIEIEEYLGR